MILDIVVKLIYRGEWSARMRLIDSHIHLNAIEYQSQLPALLREANARGVDGWVIPGTLPMDIPFQIEIANQFSNCFNAFGIHPWFLESLATNWEADLIAGIEAYSPVAIGECGLDFAAGVEERQFDIFEKQVVLAKKYQLPLIIHSYKAVDQALKILRKYQGVKGIFHGFNGSLQQLSQVLELGFYVGFGGNVTYPRASKMRALLMATPLERLLLETDGPYQAGSYRQRSEIHYPADLVQIARYIAEQKSLEVVELAKITFENAINLFSLEMK